MPISWGGARGVNVGIYGIHGVSGIDLFAQCPLCYEASSWNPKPASEAILPLLKLHERSLLSAM